MQRFVHPNLMNRRVRAFNLALVTILLCAAFAFGQNSSLRIIGIPQPVPPGDAERGHIQGTIILRIEFLGSGQIGTVAVVKGLTPKLNEIAVEAAKTITFTPQQIDGKPTDTFKQLEYGYIYGGWSPRRSLPVFPQTKQKGPRDQQWIGSELNLIFVLFMLRRT